MFKLQTFYQSREWCRLMEEIKQERTNEEGKIICELCGKEIYKRYDCIGHHKQELNELNVNNLDISLNSNNIMLLHMRCHNEIHHKLDSKYKNVYLIYGSPCSGKTTYVNNNMVYGDLVLDIDNIWQSISGLDRYIKPNKLKPIVFNVRDTILNCIKFRQGNWNNAYIIGGYPLRTERDRLSQELGAKTIFIDATKEECISRLYENPEGRDVEEWQGYIEHWFDMFVE